jgi:hypothetical protein
VTTVARVEACIKKEPPKTPEAEVSGQAQGCPAPWVLCIDRFNAVKLMKYLEDLYWYAQDAYGQCGPEEKVRPALPARFPHSADI